MQRDELEKKNSEDQEERLMKNCSVLGCKWDDNVFCPWHNETALREELLALLDHYTKWGTWNVDSWENRGFEEEADLLVY